MPWRKKPSFVVVVEVSDRRLGKRRVIDSFLNFPFLVCFCEEFSIALHCYVVVRLFVLGNLFYLEVCG